MTMLDLARAVERLFLPIAVGLSALALWHPPLFAWLGPHIPLALGIIMLGMGMTLEFRDFGQVARRWPIVLFGLALQYAIMPLLALAASSLLDLPGEAMIGVVLVGSCPSGTASNVISYLARANVPLSVVLTLTGTLLAPLATPALVEIILGTRIEVDFAGMVRSVFWIVVFPLVDGLLLRRLLRRRLEPVLGAMPAVSILVISLVIACIVALNQKAVLSFPAAVMAAVLIHNLGGFALGYAAARLARCNEADARTLAIEVGIQNSGLAVALAAKHFTAAAALPGALFSLWQNIAGAALARRWAGRDAG